MIIAVSGKRGSGKSTVAEYFTNRDFELKSFAGPLKKLIAEVFELPMFLLTDQEAKERHQLTLYVQREHVEKLVSLASKLYPITAEQEAKALANLPQDLIQTPRQLLQVVGTDVFRNNIDTEYWLNVFKASIQGRNYICDDARFENERALIKSLGGFVIGLNRPGMFNQDTHSSENVDLSNCDFVVQNKYNIQDLRSEIDTIFGLIKELSWGSQKSGTKLSSYVELSGAKKRS